MAYKRTESKEDIKERVRARGKKFVSYKEGAELYSLGLHTFQQIAKDAKAIYRVKSRVLINTEIVDEYMEMFHEFND
jgi:hypothetical protein